LSVGFFYADLPIGFDRNRNKVMFKGNFFSGLNKRAYFILFMTLGCLSLVAQTKVSGEVVDVNGQPVAYANILFKNSVEGTITNVDGRFYLESDTTYETLVASFIGYETLEMPLEQKVNYNLKIVLTESDQRLDEVIVYSGKQSKKNNPAVEILKKIWAKKTYERT
jgi:hypothetical protein